MNRSMWQSVPHKPFAASFPRVLPRLAMRNPLWPFLPDSRSRASRRVGAAHVAGAIARNPRFAGCAALMLVLGTAGELVHPAPAVAGMTHVAGRVVAAAAHIEGAQDQFHVQMRPRAEVLSSAARPPRARFQQDPADSLYRAARATLNRAEYRAAADLFRQIRTRFPRSAYAPDALHWEAFALYRLGGTDDLRAAVAALELQGERYPEADTRADSEALGTRIRGELAQRGDAPAAERLTQQAEKAAASCTADEDDDLRIAALNALIQMDSDRALPILEQVLARRDACSARLREKAVFLISQHETSETADILLETARNDPSVEVRREAVFWLSQVESDRAVAALEQILQESRDGEVRERAIFALSQHESGRAGEILRTFAQQAAAPSELRERAIFGLGQNESQANAAFLRGLYGRLSSAELKERVLFSISQMGGQQNGRWLLDLALDAEEPLEMRKKALFWAGQSDVPIDQLTALYDNMPGLEMQEQLVYVYSQRDEPEAIDALIDIVRTEQDTDLRKKALFWLGQSDDPRAIEVLMEIINRE